MSGGIAIWFQTSSGTVLLQKRWSNTNIFGPLEEWIDEGKVKFSEFPERTILNLMARTFGEGIGERFARSLKFENIGKVRFVKNGKKAMRSHLLCPVTRAQSDFITSSGQTFISIGDLSNVKKHKRGDNQEIGIRLFKEDYQILSNILGVEG